MIRVALTFLVVLLSIIQLQAQDNWLSKRYYAYHTHKSFELRFDRKGQYTQITNHRKKSKSRGRYELMGDTVVLYRRGREQEHKEFYIKSGDSCIVLMPWRYGYYNSPEKPWGEKQIDINYPQLPMIGAPKMEVEKMVQTVIDSIQTQSAYDSTLYIKPYYEINQDNNYRFKRFGSEMRFIGQTDDEGNYIEINTFGLDIEKAAVIITVKPYIETRIALVATFKKVRDKWVVDGRIN